MKQPERDKTVKTIPNGVWEGSRPPRDRKQGRDHGAAADMQGNGYPVNRQGR